MVREQRVLAGMKIWEKPEKSLKIRYSGFRKGKRGSVYTGSENRCPLLRIML